jgi:hypothetical protein
MKPDPKKAEQNEKKLQSIEKFFDSSDNENPRGENKPLLFSYNATWKSYWDIFIILVAIYSGFFIPFVLAFDHMEPIISE